MCGIVAIMGKPSTLMQRAFETMLMVDIVRGKDSTGVAAITKDNVHIVKDILYPPQLIHTREYEQKVKNNVQDIYCYIGHNRAATKGVINKDNAHPYRFGAITMVHNGTLIWDMEPEKGMKFATDSESIAYSLAHRGIDWTWNNLRGAAALCWYDAESDTMNIITNRQRPLFFAYSKKKDHVFVSSEMWIIENAIRYEGYRLHEKNCWFPKADMLFTFHRKDNGKIAATTAELEPYKNYAIYSDYKGNKTTFPNKENDKKVVDLLGYDTKKKELTDYKGDDISDIYSNYYDHRKYMNEYDFKRKYPACYYCDSSLEDEYDDAIVLDDEAAICGGCAATAAMNNMMISKMGMK